MTIPQWPNEKAVQDVVEVIQSQQENRPLITQSSLRAQTWSFVKVQCWFDYFYLVPCLVNSDKIWNQKEVRQKGNEKMKGKKEAHTGSLASDVPAPRRGNSAWLDDYPALAQLVRQLSILYLFRRRRKCPKNYFTTCWLF